MNPNKAHYNLLSI